MSIRKSLILMLIMFSLVISACNNIPNHANYIPKDATMVVGVNTVALGKKIAWDAIWGSKLLDEMKKGMDKGNVMKDFEKSGIKQMTTYYLYLKNDKRYSNGQKITAIIPLDDAKQWESYLKKINPQAGIKDNKGRKEALMNNDIYAGWNDNLLIITNTVHRQTENLLENINTEDPAAMDSLMKIMQESGDKIDDEATVLEMAKAFTVSKENAITSNKNFIALEKAGHDITVWVNYEMLSGEYMNASMTGGLALSSSLLKDAAMATGIDFEKGSINGKMLYYMSDELKEICKDMGKDNTDKDMIDRLPAEKLNLLAGWHISPQSMKKIVDKMGVAGLINASLAETGITIDNILGALSGDMGLSLNNFSSKSITIPADSFYPGQQEYKTTDADIDYTFALKIGNKSDFEKLVAFAVKEKIMLATNGENYIIPLAHDTLHIIISDNYLALANAFAFADNYQTGINKTRKKEGAPIITQHPAGAYFDVKSMFNNINSDMWSVDNDTTMVNITRNLLNTVAVYGGENKGNTFEYSISISFTNKDENSLLQLINYAGKMQQASKPQQVAFKN